MALLEIELQVGRDRRGARAAAGRCWRRDASAGPRDRAGVGDCVARVPEAAFVVRRGGRRRGGRRAANFADAAATAAGIRGPRARAISRRCSSSSKSAWTAVSKPTMYEAQAQLADAYLARRPGARSARHRRGSRRARAVGARAHRALPARAGDAEGVGSRQPDCGAAERTGAVHGARTSFVDRAAASPSPGAGRPSPAVRWRQSRSRRREPFEERRRWRGSRPEAARRPRSGRDAARRPIDEIDLNSALGDLSAPAGEARSPSS